MPDDIEGLLAEAQIGDEVRKFLASDAGRTLLGIAQQEATAAEKALGRVNPEDAKEIIRLQRVIWNAENFESWLMELISNGDNALNIYRQQRDAG